MIQSGYSRYKDCDPVQTVERIRSILDEFGIETEVMWVDNGMSTTFCNRIMAKGMGRDMGTNGKGSTREYALASGYAEFMERLENDCICVRDYFQMLYPAVGYYYSGY